MVTSNIAPGEYALAIGYTDLVGITTQELPSIDAKIFPNPTNGIFNIELPENIDNTTLIAKDINGREVWRKTNINSHETLHIDMQAGVYMIYIEADNKHSFAGKLIIE